MLGNEIKKYILASGFKILAIAEKSEIPVNTFSAMLNGKRKITAEEYFSVCAALNVPLEKFANIENSQTKVPNHEERRTTGRA